MLIHITPKLFLSNRFVAPKCELIDITIEEFGIVLAGNKDLATRRPYPNKNYLVGCKKQGQKAIDGILIDTPNHVPSFTSVARWAINADSIVTHKTNYIVLDEDFDAVSDSMPLWYATGNELGNWSSRWPECSNELIPASAQPRMDVWPATNGGIARQGEVTDILGPNGLILERNETFRMPTIERDRILGERAKHERFPAYEDAFQMRRARLVKMCP